MIITCLCAVDRGSPFYIYTPFYFIRAGHAKKGADLKSRAMSCLGLRACNDIEILKGGGGER